MLTRWGKVAAGILRSGGNAKNCIFDLTSDPGTASGTFKAVNGTERCFAPYPYSLSMTILSLSSGTAGIAVGSGSTPATVDDYCLENMITSGITATIPTSSTTTYDNTHKQYVASKDIAIANNGSASITISEIGIIASTRYADSVGASASSTGTVLVDRTVLDSPVTIPAGESGVVRYEFRYDVDFTKPAE